MPEQMNHSSPSDGDAASVLSTGSAAGMSTPTRRDRHPLSNAMNFSETDQLPAELQAAVTLRHLSNEQTLFHHNEASQAVYAVKSGQIRLMHYTHSGQSISHYAVGTGEICAEVTLFLDAHTCSAIAEGPTEVLAFPKQAFLTALQDSEFAIAFTAQVCRRLHTTKVILALRSIRSARERVLHYLRLTIPTEENSIVLDQPLKNIAFDLGLSPEVLSRTLAQLVKEGVITRHKRKITLLESSL